MNGFWISLSSSAGQFRVVLDGPRSYQSLVAEGRGFHPRSSWGLGLSISSSPSRGLHSQLRTRSKMGIIKILKCIQLSDDMNNCTSLVSSALQRWHLRLALSQHEYAQPSSNMASHLLCRSERCGICRTSRPLAPRVEKKLAESDHETHDVRAYFPNKTAHTQFHETVC